MQREAEAAAEQAIARERMAQGQAEAEQKFLLMEKQMAIEQALKEQDMAARMEANALDNATRFQIANEANVLRRDNAGALEKWREEQLKVQRDRLNPKPFVPKIHHVGSTLYRETAPGALEVAMEAPRLNAVPKLSGIPVTSDPMGPKVSLPVNHPQVNQLLETLQPGSSAAFGTNWIEKAREPASPSKSGYKKGQKVRQGGKVYEFDGSDWVEVE